MAGPWPVRVAPRPPSLPPCDVSDLDVTGRRAAGAADATRSGRAAFQAPGVLSRREQTARPTAVGAQGGDLHRRVAQLVEVGLLVLIYRMQRSGVRVDSRRIVICEISEVVDCLEQWISESAVASCQLGVKRVEARAQFYLGMSGQRHTTPTRRRLWRGWPFDGAAELASDSPCERSRFHPVETSKIRGERLQSCSLGA